MNVDLLNVAIDTWTDEKIRARTKSLIDVVLGIWPVPVGHRSAFGITEDRHRQRVSLADLIAAGLIEPGSTLYARRQRLVGRTATVLPTGGSTSTDSSSTTPSGAARALSGKSETDGGSSC